MIHTLLLYVHYMRMQQPIRTKASSNCVKVVCMYYFHTIAFQATRTVLLRV